MSQPLRIAMLVGSFPVVSEVFIVRQMTGLLDLGHQVDIYADTRPASGSPVHPEVVHYKLLDRTTWMNMPPEAALWEMPVWPITGRTWLPGSPTSVANFIRVARAVPKLCRSLVSAPRLTRQVLRPSEYGYQAASLSALYRLARLISARGRCDVIHAHFGPTGNSYRFARELWRAPLIVSFHGYDFSTLPRRQGEGMYRRLFDTADAITVNSEFTRQQVEKLGCPSPKIFKLPESLRLEEFPFRERGRAGAEPVRVLTVGRLVEKKGLEYSIRAVAKVQAHFPTLRYDIIGDGPLRPRLTALIQELGRPETITLLGARDATFVQQRMAEAHLFVLASVTAADGDQEGQGLALQEAQACGLPVLATDHAAFPEGLVPGCSGFLVPERDVDALAERLVFLVQHPEFWPAMGREGRKFVEGRFDAQQLNRSLVALYKQTIQAFRAP